jgi:enoyl-CoA hydratase/carnithine racemase
VIAAVEGAAAGAGFSLALACDFMVAAENALFVMAHSTVGLSPDGGGSLALARALPRTVVARLLMLGERIPAAQLNDMGLVHALAPVANALSAALQLAEQLNERAPNVLASIKDLINEAQANTLSEQLASERDHFVKNLQHRNAGEGIEAFLQKRKPLFF